MKQKILTLSAAFLCLFGLLACVNLKPVPSETQSFILGPVAMVPKVQNADVKEAIYIMRPQVPTYLDGSRLSYRSASGEVKTIPRARWAEPLAEGIGRAMSLYISGSSLHGPAHGYYPWPNTSSDASRLSINFQRFAATNTGEVLVVAIWSLKRNDGSSASGQYTSESLKWTVGQPETMVAAYNQALRALVHEIGKGASAR